MGENTMICPTRGHDFSNLHRLLNPLNRAKQCIVLFGLMAVSLTCLFSVGGPGARRRLPFFTGEGNNFGSTLKEYLDAKRIPSNIKYVSGEKCYVHFEYENDVFIVSAATVIDYINKYPQAWKNLAVASSDGLKRVIGGNTHRINKYMTWLRNQK